MVQTLRERSRKVERKKGERYSQEFRHHAVERRKACNNILGLSRELGIHRRPLYNWRDRSDESNPGPRRSRELILRKQITKLKGLLANKTMEVDFFRRALQKVGARRRQTIASGAKAFLP
jgi:transposase-like protein